MEQYWCMNCEGVRLLDVHGKCSCCSSEAVCLADPGRISYDASTVEHILGTVQVGRKG